MGLILVLIVFFMPLSLSAKTETYPLIQEKVGFYSVQVPDNYKRHGGKRYWIVLAVHGSGATESAYASIYKGLKNKDVILVTARAPHAHVGVMREKNVGYTLWPNYPQEWGTWGSPLFPRKKMSEINIEQIYTDWLHDVVEDVRRRFPTKGDRIAVMGHSQGASVAFRFVEYYPDVVEAVYGNAGIYHRLTTNNNLANSIKREEVRVSISHNTDDKVVQVQETIDLGLYLAHRGITFSNHIFPTGGHFFTKNQFDVLAAFVKAFATEKKEEVEDEEESDEVTSNPADTEDKP